MLDGLVGSEDVTARGNDLSEKIDRPIYMGHRRTKIIWTMIQQCRQRTWAYRFVVFVCEMDRSLLRSLPAWSNFKFLRQIGNRKYDVMIKAIISSRLL